MPFEPKKLKQKLLLIKEQIEALRYELKEEVTLLQWSRKPELKEYRVKVYEEIESNLDMAQGFIKDSIEEVE